MAIMAISDAVCRRCDPGRDLRLLRQTMEGGSANCGWGYQLGCGDSAHCSICYAGQLGLECPLLGCDLKSHPKRRASLIAEGAVAVLITSCQHTEAN